MTQLNGNELVRRGSLRFQAPVAVAPRADVFETPEAYVLELDMPGAVKEAISVSLDQESLMVEADTRQLVSREDGIILANEIRRSRFSRVFAIGQGIKRDAVDARFENGVLTVKLFKAEEMKPREIQIR